MSGVADDCTTCGDTGLIAWMVESDPNCYREPDVDGKVPCPDCAPQTSQPHGLGSTKGEKDGKQGGVHSGRARQVAEGFGGRGIHVRPGVLDRSGSRPQGRVSDGTGRGLTNDSPGGPSSPGDASAGISTPLTDPQLAQLDECSRLLGGSFDYPFDGGPEGDYPDEFVSDDEARRMQERADNYLERGWLG